MIAINRYLEGLAKPSMLRSVPLIVKSELVLRVILHALAVQVDEERHEKEAFQRRRA
jgi:hypothetical protein